MRAAILVALVALAGCRDTGEVDCGDGTLCPPGTVCHAATASCPSIAQVEACDGVADEAPCAYPGVTDGVCFDGVCIPAGCGNGRLEDGEVCDDGNRDHGDGCAADCRSDETCGNLVTDIAVNEQCDDGNLASGDGCQADCQDPRCGDGVIDAELNEACDDGDDNSIAPDAACRPSCQPGRCGDDVIDPARGEICDDGNTASDDGCRADCTSVETCGNGLVDFEAGEQCDDGDQSGADGCSQLCQFELLAWDEDAFETPVFTGEAVAAFDLVRGRVVVLGQEQDTWEWDGFRWTQRHPATVPPARYSAAMAYDLARREIVLFGGAGFSSGFLGDTWTWDGETWTPHPGAGPTARRGATMAYDPVSERVVLHGGLDAGGWSTETWRWDGAAWTPLTTTGLPPPALASTMMVYDPPNTRMVLVGYRNLSGPDETWVLSGNAWSQVTTVGTIPRVDAGFMVYNARRDRVVLHEGLNGHTHELHDATWTSATTTGPVYTFFGAYDASRGVTVTFESTKTWTLATTTWKEATPPAPEPHVSPGLAYDARFGQVVMFGGQVGGALPDDTWLWEVDRWRHVKTLAPPSGRVQPAMTYDAAREEVVLFGGLVPGPSPDALRDTWRWTGADWAHVPTIAAPVDRYQALFAYDAARGEAVLHGGLGVGSAFNDTWTWNGAMWVQEIVGPHPPVRYSASMAFDPRDGRTILCSGNNELFDTWAWNGVSWADVTPTTAVPRGVNLMVLHDALGAPMLIDEDANAWLWDGTAWQLRLIPGAHPDPELITIAYDARARAIVAVGDPSGSTWTLGWRSDALDEWCATDLDTDGDGLAGCDDPDCEGWCASCGDAVCDPLETCWSCPGDCTRCDLCGDYVCDPSEAASCPGDCS